MRGRDASRSGRAAEPEAHQTMDAVAQFYEQVVFPSRGAHVQYQDLLPAEPGQRVGDFGCGQSIFHDALRGYRPQPTFLDRSLPALRTIEHGLRICADLRRLPLASDTYDVIYCIGVLHHLPERVPIWAELARVLRPTGRLHIGVYAPGSVQSHLRRLHDARRNGIWRKLVFGATSLLVGLRYASKPDAAPEVRLRTRDFLEVPHVQYASPETYAREAAAAGLRLERVQRIAAMNLLRFGRI